MEKKHFTVCLFVLSTLASHDNIFLTEIIHKASSIQLILTVLRWVVGGL